MPNVPMDLRDAGFGVLGGYRAQFKQKQQLECHFIFIHQAWTVIHPIGSHKNKLRAKEGAVIFFWNLIIHALIIACTLGLVFFVFVAIKAPEHAGESLLRLVAAAIGFLICMGAKALGLSIPELIFNAGIYRIGLWSLLIPCGVGVAVTAIFVEAMLASETIFSRVSILLSVFIITAFADIYIASYAVESNKFLINKALAPNLFFIIGVAGYAIFNVDPKKFKN